MGVQRSTVTRLFNASHPNPTLDTIADILRALGLQAEIKVSPASPEDAPIPILRRSLFLPKPAGLRHKAHPGIEARGCSCRVTPTMVFPLLQQSEMMSEEEILVAQEHLECMVLVKHDPYEE